MRWRSWLVVLHRDIGFLCVGLTLAYAISGIAVNHKHDWDYNRTAHEETRAIGRPAELLGDALTPERKAAVDQDAAAMTAAEEHALVRRIGELTGQAQEPRNVFWRGPKSINLFFGSGDSDTVDYDPTTGVVRHAERKDRIVLRDLNFLHLNEGHRVWAWIADGYAASLMFLAISGALLVRGRRGLRGRGGVLLAIGLVVPIMAVILMRHT